MPRESTNLKLKLYNATTDALELARTWFDNIFDYSNSNWTKIDDAYKELQDSINDRPTKDGTGATGDWNISAEKLSTSAGSATNPVYFMDGKPVPTTYSLNKSVPADAEFTDTWRGIQDNLTSTSTTDSLSARQGKILKDLMDNNPLTIYPVGSIYQSTDPTSPASLFGGTWESISSGRVLMGVDSRHQAGTTVNAGLPNITGGLNFISASFTSATGAFAESSSSSGGGRTWNEIGFSSFVTTNALFSASSSNNIYGSSSTVQPPAYFVYMWRRIE